LRPDVWVQLIKAGRRSFRNVHADDVLLRRQSRSDSWRTMDLDRVRMENIGLSLQPCDYACLHPQKGRKQVSSITRIGIYFHLNSWGVPRCLHAHLLHEQQRNEIRNRRALLWMRLRPHHLNLHRDGHSCRM